MALWYARNVTGATAWKAGNQKVVAGPVVTISGTIPSISGAMSVYALAPTTMTATANIQDSTATAVPDGVTVLVMKSVGTTLIKEGETTTSGGTGLVTYTKTQLPPHPNYVFVIPRQTGYTIETICTPEVTPV
jgi:hypothetical protein